MSRPLHLKSMKPFSFSDWDSPLHEAVESLYASLPPIRHVNLPLETLKENQQSAEQIASQLRTLVQNHVFKNVEEEIVFFKAVKPTFLSALLYWRWRLQFSLHAPEQDPAGLKKYTKKKIKDIRRFLARHQNMLAYLRGGYRHLDQLYFLQNRFSVVAKIQACEMLLAFLQEPKMSQTKNPDLQWTGTRAGLVELIYALQSGGVFNNGQASLRELVSYFEASFNLNLPNFYHTFNEIRIRKKNRTLLLDTLREKFIRRMDSLDER